MKSTKSFLLKLCAAAAGPAVFIQVGSCDSQRPPDNTECSFGVCVATPPPTEARLFDDAFVEDGFPAGLGDN